MPTPRIWRNGDRLEYVLLKRQAFENKQFAVDVCIPFHLDSIHLFTGESKRGFFLCDTWIQTTARNNKRARPVSALLVPNMKMKKGFYPAKLQKQKSVSLPVSSGKALFYLFSFSSFSFFLSFFLSLPSPSSFFFLISLISLTIPYFHSLSPLTHNLCSRPPVSVSRSDRGLLLLSLE